jgi:shikimate kinase
VSPHRSPPVVLVGLMGSGKTSVAKRLARRLGRPVRDSDLDLEAAYGETAAEQAARLGADELHAREARVLRDALADDAGDHAPVIAAAASTVEDPACREALAPAFVVWLDAPPHVLADRMRGGSHRPHYDPDLEKMVADQYQRRARWFREVADLTVDVTSPTPDQVGATVLAAFARSTAS